jgi:ferredoxin
MTYPMMQHIPLTSAYLCQDCNSIGNCAEQCPACASVVLLNLASILDRESVGDSAMENFSLPRLYPHAVAAFNSMVA